MKKRYGIQKAPKSKPLPNGYYRGTNPFSTLSDEQREYISRALAQSHETKFKEAFDKLCILLEDIYPNQTLSHFAFYDLTVCEAYPEVDLKYKSAAQHHVELLQALFLSIPKNLLGYKPASIHDFLEINEQVKIASESFAMRRQVSNSGTSEERHFQMASEQVRIQTQAIRNWGYSNQVFPILTNLFQNFDSEFFTRCGFQISKLVQMCQNIFKLVEDRFEKRRNLVRPVMRATNIQRAVACYYEALPNLVGSSTDFINAIQDKALNLEETKSALLEHYDLSLSDCYTFTIEDFQNAYPTLISPDIIEKILSEWSLSFGDLADKNREHFFLANPIWEKPIIRLADGKFFWPLLELFLSFGLNMLQNILRQQPDLYRKYEETIRPEFLEDKVEALFRKAFPTANILKGSLWHDYENDLLVCLDSYIIIVESKSGKFDTSAQRGGKRLKEVIEDLIDKPSRQAARFAEFLRSQQGNHAFSTKRGVTNYCNTTGATHIIQLNVTFELLGPICSERTTLQKANLLSADLCNSITIAMTDLENLFELLPGVHQKLHYLERRVKFEGNVDFTADEFDLLAFYFQTGFNIGDVEYNRENSLHLYGIGHILDPYFLSKVSGNKVEKPQLRLNKRWKDILRTLEERQFKGWTEIGVCLLNVSYEDQINFEQQLKKVIKNVRHNWHVPNHNSTVVLSNGPLERRDAIVGYAYKRISTEERNRMIRAAIGTAAEISQADRVVVISIDCDHDDFPYNPIAFVPSIQLDELTSTC